MAPPPWSAPDWRLLRLSVRREPSGRAVSPCAYSLRKGEVLVSRTDADLLAESDITFHDHGEHELKGVPGTWRLST
jgi:hypothetical protein